MSDMKKQYISFELSAEICNRIKRFFSALRFEVNWNEPLDFYWSQGDLCNHAFSELFSFDLYKVNEIFCIDKVNLEDSYDVGADNDWRLLIKDDEVPEGFTKAFPPDDSSKEYIDFEYNRIPENVKKEYKKYFDALLPTTDIEKRINQVALPPNTVSVHVGQSSERAEYYRVDKDSVCEYIDAMRKYPNDVFFFLVADELVANRIRNEFPDRIIELPEKDYYDAYDTVAELYLLGKTKELIATYGNTFSEVAWWLGGGKQNVTVVGRHDEGKIKCPICKSEAKYVLNYPKSRGLELYRHLYLDVPGNLDIVDYQIFRCKKCELVFSYPMHGGSQNFYSWVTAHENYYPTKENPRWEWGVVREYIKANELKSVLEVGCGTGEFLDYVTSEVDINIIGLDTTKESCEVCEKKGYEVYSEPLEKYKVNNSSKIDLVVAFHLLEHVENPLGLVKDMMDLLNKGGKCMLSFPYSAVDIETCFTTANNMPPHHLTRWSRVAIEALAKAVNADYELISPPSGELRQEILNDLRNEFYPIYESTPSRRRVLMKAMTHLKRTKQIVDSERKKEDIYLKESIEGQEILRRPPWFVLLVLTKR